MTGLPGFSPSQHNWLVHPSVRPKKKGIGEQLAALSCTAGRWIQTMTAILKGNLCNPGNLDIKVSKPRCTQNKYIHISHHIRNNNPEPQIAPSKASSQRKQAVDRENTERPHVYKNIWEVAQAFSKQGWLAGGLSIGPAQLPPSHSVRNVLFLWL